MAWNWHNACWIRLHSSCSSTASFSKVYLRYSFVRSHPFRTLYPKHYCFNRRLVLNNSKSWACGSGLIRPQMFSTCSMWILTHVREGHASGISPHWPQQRPNLVQCCEICPRANFCHKKFLNRRCWASGAWKPQGQICRWQPQAKRLSNSRRVTQQNRQEDKVAFSDELYLQERWLAAFFCGKQHAQPSQQFHNWQFPSCLRISSTWLGLSCT